MDLSAPDGCSVNDGIDPLLCSVSYLTVDSVMKKVMEEGRGALLAKFDLKSAYRTLVCFCRVMEWGFHDVGLGVKMSRCTLLE